MGATLAKPEIIAQSQRVSTHLHLVVIHPCSVLQLATITALQEDGLIQNAANRWSDANLV